MEAMNPIHAKYTRPMNVCRLSTSPTSVSHHPSSPTAIARSNNKSRNVLLNLATKEEISWLSEHELVLCQSILVDFDEVDEESQDFRQNNTKKSSAKVCFRCLYCMNSPLAPPNAGFSFAKTSPGCIEYLGDTLKLMSKRHFQVQGECILMPDYCRSVFEKGNEDEEATENGLQKFCENIALRYKFVNNHPYKTGVTCSNSFQAPIASVYHDNFLKRKKTVENLSSATQGLLTKLQYNEKTTPYAAPFVCRPSHCKYYSPPFFQPADASYLPPWSSNPRHVHDYPNSHEYPSTVMNRYIAQKSMGDSHNLMSGVLPQFTSRPVGDDQRIINNAANPIALVNCRRTCVEDPDPDDVVLEEDRPLLTDYFFAVNKELKLCHFTQPDRKSRGGNRDHIEIGYGGLQCRHCAGEGRASRKFFWSSVDRLANSFAEILIHINKCSKVPDEVKEALGKLKLVHPQQMKALPRGSQKVFFRRVWRRMHIKDNQEPERDSLNSKQKSASKFLAREEFRPISLLNDNRSATSSSSKTKRTLLAILEDKAWLSDFDCFVRRNIEVFCASEEDVADTMNSDSSGCNTFHSKINAGRVGIRCVHCAAALSSMESKARQKTAITFYPPTISSIYESVQEIQRIHLLQCPHMSSNDKVLWSSLQGSSNSLTSVLRRYYNIAGSVLGMRDTSDGIRTKKGHLDPNICLYFDNNASTNVDTSRSETLLGDILLERQNLVSCSHRERESHKRKRTDNETARCFSKFAL